jgi:hypothetical protein
MTKCLFADSAGLSKKSVETHDYQVDIGKDPCVGHNILNIFKDEHSF